MSYWVFQANPKKFFILHYYLHKQLPTHPNEIDWWASLGKNIAVGDTVFIWKAYGEPKPGESPLYFEYKQMLWETQREKLELGSGIYALAKVVRAPYTTSISHAGPENMEWHVQPKDPEKLREVNEKINAPGLFVDIRYTHNYVKDPLLEKVDLWEKYKDPEWCTEGLGKLNRDMRYRAISVFPQVDEKTADLLLNMLKSHTQYSVADRQLK
jgi:hypothetical protein